MNAKTNLGKYATGESIDLTCEHCGTVFRRFQKEAAKSKNHFCSLKCFGLWQRVHPYARKGPRKVLSGPDHPGYKGKVECVCIRCGKTFLIFPSWVAKGEGLFCSRACTRNRVAKECAQCGKGYEVMANEAPRSRFCSRPCKAEWQRHNRLGAESPGWRGGYDPYYGPNWRERKRAARKRDGFTCQRCGITEERLNRKLDVHHIIPFRTFGIERYREANRLENLISLCHLCHLQTEPRRI